MNKKYIIFLILAIAMVIGLAVLWYNLNVNSNENSNYNATRTAQNVAQDNMAENSTDNNVESNNAPPNNDINNQTTPKNNDAPESQDGNNTANGNGNSSKPKETEIASFTTKIYNKDPDRQNNVKLACKALNNTTVENGATFSFSKTVGKATSKKGYKKADVFKNGEVIEALGGGLCQVSTTIYNAVLKVPEIKVTERHAHSNKVPYIKSGRDAAVSFGTYDFKFVNNTGSTLKLKAENTANNVTIKILKV